MFGVEDGPLLEEMRRNILHINGDGHRRLRNLVNPSFTPRAADRWRPAMREFLERCGRRWRAPAGASSSADFAKPYPSLTIATVMGAPLDDAPRLHEWSNWIQRQFDAPQPDERARADRAAVRGILRWCGRADRARRDDPGDDLISTLIAAEHEGDRLSEVECMNLVLNVLVGGVDTTQSQLAHACALFAAHPDQWRAAGGAARARAARGRGGAPLRADHALHGADPHEDVEYRDMTFPEGTDRHGLLVHRQPRRREGDPGVRHHRRPRRAPSS